jgi:hypothetical protein
MWMKLSQWWNNISNKKKRILITLSWIDFILWGIVFSNYGYDVIGFILSLCGGYLCRWLFTGTFRRD